MKTTQIYNPESTIDLKDFSDGFYFLKLTMGNTTQRIKLLKKT
jgi:hypothetical protein